MKCAYCGKEAKGTKEHIISCGILDLFPECYITFDDTRKAVHESDPMVKDVCADCNNNKISYIDSYAKDFIKSYFTRQYKEDEAVEIQYDYTMIQKVLLKYAFNDMRSHKLDCSFFDDEIKHFLMNEDDNIAKMNVTVLCGLAVNVSPMADVMMGNLKLRWANSPMLFANSTIRNIDYETGQIHLNKDVKQEKLDGLAISYVFRFNSVQFLLFCWNNDCDKIEQNNIVLECQYPYYMMNDKEMKAMIPVCTDELNYHRFEMIHVKWDGLFEVGRMRKYASGGSYEAKNQLEEEWKDEEEKIASKHKRY